MQPSHPDAPAAQPMGPYRGGPQPTPLRPPGVFAPRSLEESWIGDGVTLSLGGQLVPPKIWLLHVVMSIVAFGPLVGFVIALFYGAEPFAAPLPIGWAALFGWMWHRSLRGHKAAMLVNEGRFEEAERAMAGRTFGMESTIGLMAQARGDHERAAAAYRGSLAIIERRPAHMQPAHLQSYPREAIALTNLGRYADAQQRLAVTPENGGPYLAALRAVASAYLALATNRMLASQEVQALEQTFLPVRGAWGGLALAAYFRERARDPAGCEALLDEELRRVHADRLAGFFPLLVRWAEQRRARR